MRNVAKVVRVWQGPGEPVRFVLHDRNGNKIGWEQGNG